MKQKIITLFILINLSLKSQSNYCYTYTRNDTSIISTVEVDCKTSEIDFSTLVVKDSLETIIQLYRTRQDAYRQLKEYQEFLQELSKQLKKSE